MNYRGYLVEKDGERFTVWIGDLPAFDASTEIHAKNYVDSHIKKEHREKANFRFAD